MYCVHCGAPVGDEDLFCKSCGKLTDYGEKVSRHEALPPVSAESRAAINSDGSLNMELWGAGISAGAGNGMPFAQGPQAGEPAPLSVPAPAASGEEEPKTNAMAIAGFICAFAAWPLGLVFGAIGLFRSAKLRSGKWMSLASLGISVLVGAIMILSLAGIFRGN